MSLDNDKNVFEGDILQSKFEKLNNIKIKKAAKLKLYKGPFKAKKSERSCYSISSSRKPTKRMYNSNILQSERSNHHRSDSYTSYSSAEEKKTPILSKRK